MRLDPPSGDSGAEKHEYPTVWYREALQTKGNPPTGPWWSPLLDGEPATVGRSYAEQDRATPTVLTQVDPAPAAFTADAMAVTTAPLELSGAGPPTLTLANGGTTTATVSFSTQETSLTLELDVGFGASTAATLTLAVDGRERYTAAGPSDGTGEDGAFVLLWDLDPGLHTLTATLTGDQLGDQVTLSDLRIASSADIDRNLTAEETDVLIVVVLVAVGVLIFGLIVVAVLVVRRIITRRRNDHGNVPA